GAAAVAAGRADGGHEHRGKAGHEPLHSGCQRRVRHHHRVDRARHGCRHGHFRSRRGAGLRQKDRRRQTGRGSRQRSRHSSLSGRIPLAPRRNRDMGFFLETLFGGLMSGMLYALIGLGFVLIFKASGVFNFAQGAMVLVAALSMARFSEWIPHWLGFENLLLANVLAFIISALLMFGLAVAVERYVLRYLVNQEATTLLMATLGISYFLDGLGQIAFGSSVYSIDVGMPKAPAFIPASVFEGGLLINLEDVTAAVVPARLVAALVRFCPYPV